MNGPIVYVDDEPTLCRLFDLHFGGAQLPARSFSDPEAALAFLDETPVSAVLCDYRMPAMTGLEFLAPTRHSMLLMLDEEMRHRPGGEDLVKKVLGFDRAWDERWALWLNLVAVVVAFRVFAALLFKLSTRPKTYRGADNATA